METPNPTPDSAGTPPPGLLDAMLGATPDPLGPYPYRVAPTSLGRVCRFLDLMRELGQAGQPDPADEQPAEWPPKPKTAAEAMADKARVVEIDTRAVLDELFRQRRIIELAQIVLQRRGPDGEWEDMTEAEAEDAPSAALRSAVGPFMLACALSGLVLIGGDAATPLSSSPDAGADAESAATTTPETSPSPSPKS